MAQENDKQASAAERTEPSDLAPSSVDAQLQELQQKLEEKEEEVRANHERFLRERAELENFKKRLQREKTEALRFACEPLIRDLLPVIDNLERAVEHGEGNGQSVLEGVRLILKSLQETLERHGVKRIDAVGARFDPALHEAMAQVPSDKHEPNRVVAQHHTGYLLHDRLLRPALVTVSGPKSNSTVESKDDSD